MPCLSQQKPKEKPEEKAKRDASQGTAKKVFIPPSISRTAFSRRANGVCLRDIGTQVRCQGDGRNLSLMELDILSNTGAKWSRVLFSGYKGYVKP